jgi:hypothetical protein
VIAADVEPRKSNPVSAWTIRVLSSLKASPLDASHRVKPRLDLFGLLAAGAHHDEIICEPHRDGAVRHRTAGVSAGGCSSGPSGRLHPMQGHD